MEKDFRACAACTSACFKDHCADATQAAPPTYTRSPCFLLTSLEMSTNWTPIPREFVESYGETLRGTARIFGANGKEWTVEIGGPGKLLGFKGGWKNFVASTSVKRGDQMLFWLVSKNSFSMHVFNKLGVEVVPAPPVDIKPTVGPAATGKRKRQEVQAEPESDCDASDDNDGSSSDSDMSEYDAKSDAESSSESDTEASPKFDEEEVISLKNRKKVKRKLSAAGSRNSKVDSKPSSKKVRANCTKEGLHIEPGSCTTTYESRRRVVTKAETDRTMEKARALKTEFASIPVLMMPSHVYRGFWLTIPGKFSKKFMPQERIDVKLKDDHGYEWPATWIRSDKHTGLSGGWAAFSKDHCLEEGDVCVFEVTNTKDWTIAVHIFRVVEVDLKPGTRGGWEKTYNIIHGALRHQPGVAKKFKSRTNTVNKKSTTVKKKTTESTAKETVRRKASLSDEESDSQDSDVEDSDAEDDLPLKKLCKDKSDSDVTSEEIDVKPKIISMRPIPKITNVKSEPGVPAATIKVKSEPGVVLCCVGPEIGFIHSGDVKPTLEQLKASLGQGEVKPTLEQLKASPSQGRSSLTSASIGIVKPEPVDSSEPLLQNNEEVERTWHSIVRMLGKRMSPKSPYLPEFLVNLGPRVTCNPASSSASEDGNGNWWVPRSQFSLDLASCHID